MVDQHRPARTHPPGGSLGSVLAACSTREGPVHVPPATRHRRVPPLGTTAFVNQQLSGRRWRKAPRGRPAGLHHRSTRCCAAQARHRPRGRPGEGEDRAPPLAQRATGSSRPPRPMCCFSTRWARHQRSAVGVVRPRWSAVSCPGAVSCRSRWEPADAARTPTRVRRSRRSAPRRAGSRMPE
jgi:hypothetical protein